LEVPVAPDRDRLVGRQVAGHARGPQHLLADRAHRELVDLGQLLQAAVGIGMHAGDQLELALAEVGGDVRMGERRAERYRMRREGERAVGAHAQAFLLDAAAQVAEGAGGQ
jgi:hypothetical protein